MNDWMKENTFYFFGPVIATRILGTAAGVTAAVALSMPFDPVKTRMHTMRPLPNGKMPYDSSFDCFLKMVKYECNPSKFSHAATFYSGGQAYTARLFAIAWMSQSLLDYYH